LKDQPDRAKRTPCPAIFFAKFFGCVDSVSHFRQAKNFLLFATPLCDKKMTVEVIRRSHARTPVEKHHASN
jgi:hypothetical protein